MKKAFLVEAIPISMISTPQKELVSDYWQEDTLCAQKNV